MRGALLVCIALCVENDVKPNLSYPSVPPKIIRLENTSSVEGGSAELTCHSEGDPAPTMTFQKAGEQPYAYGANVSNDTDLPFNIRTGRRNETDYL